SSVNDFVVRFANVNGSGSASANEMFARSILRHGVPVSPRNVFPSNIQGLPTWYEVRVTEDSHLGARGGVDMMVAMNPQTWDKDIASIEPGGYLFYDSTKQRGGDEEVAMHQPPIPHVASTDPDIAGLIEGEARRQFEKVRLIPSENYASVAVLEATGSVLTNKYSEGYPGRRYYEGQQFIDPIETLARD